MPAAPTPTNVLAKRGSWRANTRPNEPKPKLCKPRAPSWLDDGGKREYRRVCRELHAMQVLAKTDRDVVALYAQAVADVARLSEHLAEVGETWENPRSGALTRRPETLMVREARDLVVKLSRDLGLSPAYRSRVEVIEEREKPDGKARFFS